jgi:hypothetical protein
MSLTVSPTTRTQLNNIEEAIKRYRKTLYVSLQQRVWTEQQVTVFDDIFYTISLLLNAINNLIHDNQPPTQQKRP